MLIDTHAHLDDFADLKNIEEFLNDNIVIISGTNLEDNKRNLEMCQKYKNLYCTLGIHPSEANNDYKDAIDFILININNPKVVGIGEVGIDLYWVKDNLDVQKRLFELQIEIAKKNNKTIVIHTRESLNEVYNTLASMQIGNLPIVLHCYNGDMLYYEKFTKKFNVKFGIGGVVTYKNAKELKDFVLKANLDHIILETDSPYLSPEPYRGKKNSSNNLKIIANKISELRGIELEKIVNITTKNSISQFDLKA